MPLLDKYSPVPPVLIMSYPKDNKFLEKSTMPVLSDTEINAFNLDN